MDMGRTGGCTGQLAAKWTSRDQDTEFQAFDYLKAKCLKNFDNFSYYLVILKKVLTPSLNDLLYL